MNEKGKSFYALFIFLIAEAIQIVVSVIMLAVVSVTKMLQMGSESGEESSVQIEQFLNSGINRETQYLISVLAILVCGIIFFFWYRYEVRGEVKMAQTLPLKTGNIILLVCLGLGSQFAISGAMSILQNFFVKLFEDYEKQINSLQEGSQIVVLLLVLIIAPVTEELIFRGVILHRTSRYLTFLGANLLQAVLFGIYHFNIVQGIYAAILGFVLGLVCKKFGTVLASIFLHIAVNLSSYLMVFMPQNIFVIIGMTIIGAVLMIVTLKRFEIKTLFTMNRINERI